MGTRIKTFVSTGEAPNGRLYAGDLNSIQDQYADLVNYSQTIGAATYAVGESGLQLLRHAAGEARISGHLRTDGIIRSAAGLLPPVLTTAQRDALTAGNRPEGLTIYNTDVNRLEINRGTDAAPSWAAAVPDPFPIGAMQPYAGEPASLTGVVDGVKQPGGATIGIVEPLTGWYLCNGAELLDAQFTALRAFLGGAYGIPFAASFKLPDFRNGRAPLGKGTNTKFDTRGEIGGGDTVTLGLTEVPAHNHGGGIHSHGVNDPAHVHDVFDLGHDHGDTVPEYTGGGPHTHKLQFGYTGAASGGAFDALRRVVSGGAGTVDRTTDQEIDIALNPGHSHHMDHDVTGVTINPEVTGIVVNNSIAIISSQGSGGAHENMPPYQVVGGWIIKVRDL